MKFAKAHSLGNDFILIQSNNVLSKNYIKNLANYKTGVGADQILIMNENHFLNIYNQDGSTAKMCLNGIRAFAKWLNEKKIIFETISGKVCVCKCGKNLKTTLLFAPKILQKQDFFLVHTGNQHKIYILDNEPHDLHQFADKKYNVSCIWKVENHWHAKTYERGVGPTLSCGSAAFAIAHVLKRLKEKNLSIFFQLGAIEHINKNNEIYQIGTAKIVAEGIIK